MLSDEGYLSPAGHSLPRPGAKGRSRSRFDIYPAAKRVIDVVGAALLILLAFPLLIVLVTAIRIGGSRVFYSQERLGRGGRTFRFWKFRTMVPDAELALARYLDQNPMAKAEWDLTQKLRRDPRVTPVGRILRKYSLDELPQLFNVLTGDMSLIGPRPMFPAQRPLYPGIPYGGLRPGITGLWQVTDRNACAFAERARFDYLYAETMSLRTDAWIVWRTAFVVCRGTGC
ncbi:MAG: sugar transferase [Devosia sp.]|nr:sugar transferase [Devosia sp.]